MTETEQAEYQGLAAAVGRFVMALKVTEDKLVAVASERDALAAERDALAVRVHELELELRLEAEDRAHRHL